MRKILVPSIVFLTFVLVAAFMPRSVFCQQDEELYRLVYFNPDVTIEDPIAAVSAMKPFSDYVGKKIGKNFEPIFFKKAVDLERYLKANKVAFGVFSQMFIVENHRRLNFEPIAIVLKEGQSDYRKVILVRKDSPYETLQDLKGKTLSTTALGEDNIPFLNKVVFRDEIDVNTHFGKMQVVDTANSAIMAVLYKQADAAAANYLNFVFLKELNPQVDHQLKSIFTSMPTPLPGLVYFRDNVGKEIVDKALKEMLIMHESPIGQQTMLAFQVEAWGPASIKDWEETAQLLGISLTEGKKEPPHPPTPVPSGTTPPQQPTTAALPTPAAVPDVTQPDVFPVKFDAISARPRPDERRVEVTATITQKKPGIDAGKVFLDYVLSTGEKGKVPAKQLEGSQFSAAISLPEISGASESQKTTYTIQSGDTMGKIAKKFLGDSRKYMLIVTLNNIKDPNVIFAGTQLTIMSGEYTGIDIDYQLSAIDNEGKEHTSKKRFYSYTP